MVSINTEKQKPKYLRKMASMSDLASLVDDVIVPHAEANGWQIKGISGNNRKCWVVSNDEFRFMFTIDNI